MSAGKAILVVDVLNGFCKAGSLASPRLAAIVAPLRAHLEAETAAGAVLIFLADSHAPDDPEFALFPPHCVAGSGEDDVVAELAELVARGHVVRKRHYSGFFGTELEELLTGLAPAVVEVVGVCTDICVLHTVAGLRDRGYRVVVRRDLVETYDGPRHPADQVNGFALAHMRDVLGAEVV